MIETFRKFCYRFGYRTYTILEKKSEKDRESVKDILVLFQESIEGTNIFGYPSGIELTSQPSVPYGISTLWASTKITEYLPILWVPDFCF